MFAPSSIESTPSGLSDVPEFAPANSHATIVSSRDRALAAVLIPARNEAASIGHVVRGCVAAGFAVTVIDDASSDATALLAAQAGAEVLSVTGPHHGKTAALHLARAHARARRRRRLSR